MGKYRYKTKLRFFKRTRIMRVPNLRWRAAALTAVLAAFICIWLFSSVAEAAISLRASSSAGVSDKVSLSGGSAANGTTHASNGGGSTSLTLNKPTSTAQGDVLIAGLTIRGGTGTTITSVPSGWTLLDQKRDSTTVLTQVVYWLQAGASEPASYQWQFTSNKATGVIMSYTNTASSSPIDTSLGQVNASNTVVTAPNITTTVATDMLVGIFGTAGAYNYTSTTMTNGIEAQDQSGTGGNANTRTSTAGADQLLAATCTNSCSKTATAATAAVNVGTLVAIKPAAATSLSLSMPTGTLQNDVMVAAITINGGSGVTITAPSGWTSIQNTNTSGNEIKTQSWWKAAGASEAGPYSFSWTGAHRASGAIISYSGADYVAPIDASTSQANASSTTVTAGNGSGGGVTPTKPGDQLLGVFGVANANTLAAVSPLTDRNYASATGSTSNAVRIADQSLTAGGATGTRTATAGTTAVSVGQLIALAPAIANLTQASHRWFSESSVTADAATWTTRTSSATSSWQSVTYGNGLFVAVSIGQEGTASEVMTSPDGIIWTTRTAAANNAWTSVTYGNGLFVAVANNAVSTDVMTSPDGITWTSRTGAATNLWQSVTYGNGLFVAVASNAVSTDVMTSPDGITWTSRTGAATNNWDSVTYGNGLFVAVATTGTGNRVMTSPDGTNWTIRTSAADLVWNGVTYGNGLFVAVASSGTGNRVMTSSNGTTWTSRSSSADTTWLSVSYGNGVFVAVGNSASTPEVMTSPDGITWTSHTAASVQSWNSVIYGNGLFVAVSSANVMTAPGVDAAVGSALASQDTALVDQTSDTVRLRMNVGVNAGNTSRALQASDTRKFALQYGSTSGTCNGSETYSDIGVSTWSTNSLGVGDGDHWSVTYGNGLFVGVDSTTHGSNTYVTTSSDGINWTTSTIGTSNGWDSVTYGNGLYVAVGTAGTGNRVMTSPDGTNWTPRTSAANNSWVSVTYGNGTYVAVSNDGTNQVMTSTNGTAWTSRTQSLTDTWTAVTYGNGLFAAVSSAGNVMTSPDGITWTTRTASASEAWSAITYGNGIFVVVGSSGTGDRVMTSYDGIKWTTRTDSTDNNWDAIAYGNGLYVAVGYSGTGNRVMTSPDGINWTTRTSAADNNWGSVAYGAGVFAATAYVGSGNFEMTMSPPVNWGGSVNNNYGTITANGSDPTQGGTTANNIAENYITDNYFTVPNDAAVNKYAQWDFDLTVSNATFETTYCFRIVNSDGSTLDSYSTYPQIAKCDAVPSLDRRLRHGASFCAGSKLFYWH